MSDSTPAVAAPPAPPQEGQSSQPQFSVPAGHRLISDADWTNLQRAEQQARGSQTLYAKAKDYGFVDARGNFDDSLGETIKSLRARGVDPSKIASMFTPVDDKKGGAQDFDPDGFKKSLMEEFEKKSRYDRALEEHDRAEKAVLKGLEPEIKKLAKEIAGEDPTAAELRAAVLQARGIYHERVIEGNSLYEEGHPLRDARLKPISLDDIVKELRQIETDKKAQRAALIGKSANSSPARKPMPTGASGGQGKANEPNDQRRRGLPDKDAITERLAQELAARR